jgi:hypothetical protein
MTSPFARKTHRKPAAEELRIKNERKRRILLVMSYDSLYHREGELVTSGPIGIMLNITMMQAAHCMSQLADDFQLDTAKIKIMTRSGGHQTNAFKLRQPSLLSTTWRGSSNDFTRLDNYRFLGAVI